MDLVPDKVIEDKRGKIVIYKFGDRQINLIETKKGFSRGGHWHKTKTSHQILVGKLEFRQEDCGGKGEEKVGLFGAPSTIHIPANVAHMMTALEDSVFIEVFENGYEATNYPKYRNTVEGQMAQAGT